MRSAKTLTALVLMVAMAGNLAAAVSCAELCAAERHHPEGQPEQPVAATHHSAHSMSMNSHPPAQPESPAAAERQPCSRHVQDAAAKGPAATLPRDGAAGVMVYSATGSTCQEASTQEITASPPPDPHLLPALPLRI